MHAHIDSFKAWKAARSQGAVARALDALAAAAEAPKANVFEQVVAAAEAGCTHGEICATAPPGARVRPAAGDRLNVGRQFDTARGTVYPWQLDHVGHMNVQFYVARFDEATWQLLANFGITGSFLRDHHRGMAALEQHTYYKRELHAGALIRIASEVEEVKAKVVRFTHRMYDVETGEEVASTTIIARARRHRCAAGGALPRRRRHAAGRGARMSPAGPPQGANPERGFGARVVQ